MKKIAVLLIFIISACSSSTSEKPSESLHTKTQEGETKYVCGPCGADCDTLVFDQEGKCPHCKMNLIKLAEVKKAGEQKEITACFYLQDGVEVLDFAGPMEVFVAAGFTVFTVSKTKEPIVSQGVLKIIPEYSIADAPPSNVMVFFGGAHGAPSTDAQVINWIKSRTKSTEYFMSVCTGAFIMGKAGVLDNMTATTYHLQIENLQKALPKTKVLDSVRFVDNGNIISTAGISAGIDGALHFVAKIKGEDFAKQIAETIEYDKWVPNEGLIVKK
jgi:transcriptional regulator GlxA family with amidase domain/DNA-directed RNA polymerase subunit RPC12/RpoP